MKVASFWSKGLSSSYRQFIYFKGLVSRAYKIKLEPTICMGACPINSVTVCGSVLCIAAGAWGECVADPHQPWRGSGSTYLLWCRSGSDLSLCCGFRCESCSLSKLCNSALLSYRPSNGSILSLHASIDSAHGPPWLHFEPGSVSAC